MLKTAEHIKKHYEILRENASECVILLKKDGNFPINAPCKVALYGNGARNTVKGGTGSGDVNCVNYNSIEKAFENEGFTVTTKNWLDAYDVERARCHSEWVNGIIQKAKDNNTSLFIAAFGATESEREYSISTDGNGDVCVYVLSRNSGEGTDRTDRKGDVYLTDTEVSDICKLNEKFEKFMLVLNVGGVVDITPVNHVKNILLLSQLGVVTGDVLVDIITGKTNPSGKLTTTWARYDTYQTVGDFGDNDDTRYKEGVYVGYRYFDSVGITPTYPFGFGLSYTEFNVEVESVKNEGANITVEVNVENVGNMAGKEVVQVYVSAPDGDIDKPYQTLVAFEKTKMLAIGEKQKVELKFNLADSATYDQEKASFILEKGRYAVRVGNSSRNTVIACVIDLADNVVTEKVKNALGSPDFTDVIVKRNFEAFESNTVIELRASDYATVNHGYIIDEHINDAVKALPEDKLINMCIGAYLPKAKLSVLGSSACHICGASGETSNYVHDVTDGKYLVLADGPAGLRISAECFMTSDGWFTVRRERDFTGFFEFLPDEMKKSIIERSAKIDEKEIVRQDTTAIPVGTAVAQSWNVEFAKLCGDIVGTECEIFKCHFWLAPAMNIHRSILCGRNFEYYSEDPFITGKIASGMVKGLQSHGKIGATVKHFCANNQERNRYNNNSIVSERAMREIYLKGFEICVKEASPKAVMTSYNLLNWEHTSQRKDLLDGILRGEWGYKGFVMTDWVSTSSTFDANSKHPQIYAHKVINAGNDIVTPGADVDFEDVSVALKEGKITRKQLEICATRIYEAIMENN
ncbi:MAG: glycoside hydrolase family 3 C-terminal domain-containing protein [Clostridia bacterium]|nr:glycoside hydrolase family 3 C-terminal domain-containing protein [Clostridia bacterium]